MAEFDPSSDHNRTLSDGRPIVSRYDLEFYIPGAASPFQVASMGKPAPQGDGKIRVGLSSVLSAFPSPGIVYEARVAAVGPTGVGRGDPSNTFMFSAPCGYTVAPLTQAVGSAGGTAAASVTAAAGCAWTAASNAGWLTITSGASGSGNGTVRYSAAASTLSTSRTGTLTVAGRTVQVTQSAACSYTVSPTTASVGAAGGTGNVNVTTASGCGWTAVSNVSWLTVTGAPTGGGSGVATWSASAHTLTSPRTGTLTVAGRTVQVTQSGVSCSVTVSPTTATVAADGGAGSVSVTAGSGCGWTATSSATWLTMTNGASGSGNGAVAYQAAANSTSASRTATLSIGGRTVTLTQEAPMPDPPTSLRIVTEP